MSNDQDLSRLGSTPIPGPAPAGSDAKGDDAFRELKAEVGKLTAVDPTVDWGKVVSLATDLLRNTTKDLLVASFLTAGLLEKNGYPGLITGLGVLRDMVESHWEGLYPSKSRKIGRAHV